MEIAGNDEASYGRKTQERKIQIMGVMGKKVFRSKKCQRTREVVRLFRAEDVHQMASIQ